MKRKSLFHTLLITIAVGILSTSSLTVLADGIWESTTSRSEEGNICIDFEEVQVLLPSSWSGKCQMNTSGDTVSFFQIKSRELWTQELGFDNGGWLFSITCTQNEDYLDLPDYQTLGTGVEGIYYATFPTDVQAYTDDAEASQEYQEMSVDMEWVKQNITVASADESSIITADGDYILPESSTSYLTASDLAELSAEEVQMAINEIYARHHRRFLLPDVQDYFDAKAWYEGTIEPDAFDVSVMNAYEGANIDLMTRQLKTLQGSN
jgi:hypothetical protein